MKIARAMVLLGLIALSFGAGEAADFGWDLPFPPQCVGNTFSDVPSSMGVLCGFVEEFSKQGITAGCGAGKYCPNDPVTRAQMAVFLYTVLKKADDEFKKLDGVKHYMTVDEKKPQPAGGLEGASTPTTLRELVINPSGLTSVTPPFYVNCSVSPAGSGLTFLETMPIVLNKDATTGLIGSATCSIRTSPPIAANQFTVTVTIRDSNPNGLYDTRTLIYEFLAPVLTTNPTTLSSGRVGTLYSSSVTMSATVDGSSCTTCSFTCSADSNLTGVGITASPNGSSCAISGTPNNATTGNMTFRATDTVSGLTSNEVKLPLAITLTPTYTLTVGSSNPASGVAITVTPNDNSSQGNGSTQFTRTYNGGTLVTLTAPQTAGLNNFSSWSGCDGAIGATCTVTMTGAKTVTANYSTPASTYVLTVGSSNPASGIAITVSPNDNFSQGSGSTQFTRTYNSGTQVTLTAPTTNFSSWSGCDNTSNGGATCTVTMTGNKSVTASYSTAPPSNCIDIPYVAGSNPPKGDLGSLTSPMSIQPSAEGQYYCFTIPSAPRTAIEVQMVDTDWQVNKDMFISNVSQPACSSFANLKSNETNLPPKPAPWYQLNGVSNEMLDLFQAYPAGTKFYVTICNRGQATGFFHLHWYLL